MCCQHVFHHSLYSSLELVTFYYLFRLYNCINSFLRSLRLLLPLLKILLILHLLLIFLYSPFHLILLAFYLFLFVVAKVYPNCELYIRNLHFFYLLTSCRTLSLILEESILITNGSSRNSCLFKSYIGLSICFISL